MVMPVVGFYKVDELPAEAEPNAFYYIQRTGYVEAWLTTRTGDPVPIGSIAVTQWGEIMGDIGLQADLVALLADKQDSASLGSAAFADASSFATAAQGLLAESAQPKEAGKGLSEQNYTLAEKQKLAGVAAEATKNRSDAGTDLLLAGKASNDDARLSDAREWSANTVTQAEAEEGAETTRRAWTAQRVKQAFTAYFGAISSTLGRTLIGRATAALMRDDLGLGAAATRDVGTAAGQVMEVGAFGLGGDLSQLPNLYPPSGFFTAERASSGGNRPSWVPALSYTSYLSLRGLKATLSHGLVFDANRGKVFLTSDYPAATDGIFSNPREIYHAGSTTKNPDGTLKASSPVINLYTDKHDLHNESQFGATPTVVRKSKGVYEITGTLGLRSEGWYLDTPSDRNGNKYFNIEWTQNITPEAEDGVVDEYRDDIVVTIETFERVWNKDTGLFESGTPMDINELQDRFVQLRFNEIKVEQEELMDEDK